MADLTGFPWALDQDVPVGSGYSAAQLRAQHYDATSGGNGVGSPGALKVQAQAAPDGTVRVVPGTATARSTYAGQDGQSFHCWFGDSQNLPVSPTGSSGRKDLIGVQVCDPSVDTHWDYSGEYPIPAAVAATMRFRRVHVFEGLDRTANLPHPFVPLAELNRPANTTIVTNSHITDLRELANPKKDFHVEGRNIREAETQSLHSTTSIWPTAATHNAKIPDFANRVQITAMVGRARSHATAGNEGVASGNFFVRLVHPDGSTLSTQQTEWRTSGEQNFEDLHIIFAHQLALPAKWRDQVVRVEFHARKYSGPNVYADGGTSYSARLDFEQEVV